MKIVLKKDWDIPIRPPFDDNVDEGYFVGREKEIKPLINEIIRRKSGSIFVSGYRGVGKTSLVYKALSEVKKKDKNTIIVLLNAAQLEAESENDGIHPRKILDNLIRRLYSTTHDLNIDTNLKDNIKSLYRKAVATEFKLIENYQHLKLSSKEKTIEKSSEFLFSESNLRNVIFISSWTLAVVLQFAKIIPYEWLNNLIPLLLAFPIPFVVNLTYKKHQETKELEEEKGIAEELYEFDNSIGNLEFDLEKIHRELRKKDEKLIYVIDELDKLKVENVKGVLKFFKNLFTLSDALFIFIAGEEMYDLSKPNKNETEENTNIYRAKEHTYFSSKYFLSRPLTPDLDRYFDMIVESSDMPSDDFETFKRALYFEANNDFFDLKTCIKGRVTDFDDKNRAIIEFKRVQNDDIKKARLQKAISVLFEEQYMSLNQTKWFENESMLREIFEHAHMIDSSYSGELFTDPTEGYTSSEMIRDFNGLLYKIDAFNIQTETPQPIKGVQVTTRTYQYTGGIPSNVPNQLDKRMEYEEKFIQEFERYCDFIISLNDVFIEITSKVKLSRNDLFNTPDNYVNQINNWGFDALSQFNDKLPLYKNISNPTLYVHRREEINEKSIQIENHTNTLLNNLPTIVANMLIGLYPQPNLNPKLQLLQQNADLFSGTANKIKEGLQGFNPPVVFKRDFSRQILLIYGKIDVIKQLKTEIKDNSKTHRVVCIIDETDMQEVDGLHLLLTKSPELLEESMNKFIGEIKQFLL